MKKVLFTSILLLSAVSFGGNIYAQDTAGGNAPEVTTPSTTQPSVKFTADGNTLTISGQGDLTSYMTTDYSARVFTNNAVGFVFADADGKTPVAAGESYNAGKTYYQAEYSYAKVWENEPAGWNTYFGEVISKKEWKEDKIANLYHGYMNWEGKVVLDYKVSSSSSTDNFNTAIDATKYPGKSQYFVSTGDVNLNDPVGVDELESKGVSFVSFAELNDYVNSDVTYQVKDVKLFLSTDGGKTFKGLTSGINYKWASGDVFYQGTASYTQIESNEAFFGTNGEHADFIKADDTKLSVAQLTLLKIQQGAYENVVFKNESTTEPLLIDKSIIRAIMYPEFIANGAHKANITLVKFDLGEATVSDFSDRQMFLPTDQSTDNYIATDSKNGLALQSLTFPLTSKTVVYSETEKANVKKMVLPTDVMSGLNGCLKLTEVTIPYGYERIANQSFKDCSFVTKVNFPETLQLIGDEAFLNNSFASVDLSKTKVENIGKDAFRGGRESKLSSVAFPSTLRIVNDGAFYGSHIKNIKLNAGLRYIGKAAFALTEYETESVLEIPASVRYIGPAAFNFRQYQDVYFYGETAPLMPLGSATDYNQVWTDCTAFSEHTLDGNTGFQPAQKSGLGDDVNTGYANRENYISGGVYFCVLHYPKNFAYEKNRATYTDVTRVYRTDPDKNQFHKDDIDGPDGPKGADMVGQEPEEIRFGQCVAGKRVNWGYQDTYLGEQYIWPSQAQFTRAYATASNGLCWDGVTKYPAEKDIETYLSEDDIATLRYAGYEIGTGEGQYSKADLAKLAHIGTRQFVLANADVNVDTEEDKEPEYNIVMKPGQWWTLCVPFNMTRKQVLETFGADTQLYFFSDVERHTINGKNSITLMFTKNALNVSSTDDEGNKLKGEDGKWLHNSMEDNVDDDNVVIWAHESYMIKPMNGQDSDKDATFVVKNYAPVVGNPLPTVVLAHGDDQLQEEDYSKEYRFIGNYLGSTDNNKVVIPKYSYVYGKTAKEPVYKFRFYTGTTSVWKPNKSLVQSHDRLGGLLDYNNFFGADKSSTLPQSAKQASIFGEENFGETTGIDDVTIIAGNEVLTPIFTLDGKMVSANGSVNGLAKGVYVKAGKKFVVK